MFLFLVFPLSVKAEIPSVRETIIEGSSEAKVGDTIPISFRINFTTNETWDTSTGVYLFLFEINYDTDVFIPSNIENSFFNTTLFQSDNKYYVYGEMRAQVGTGCASQYTYCGDILTTISFYVKNTNVENTLISMGEVEIAFVKNLAADLDPADEDVFELSYSTAVKKNIVLKKTNETIPSPPKDVTSSKKPSTSKSPGKSDNTDLKELSVENYPLPFDKTKKEYVIFIKENDNALIINAIADSDTSTVTIIGADDLKANNYEVKIIVKAENGKEETYLIRAEIKTEKSESEISNVFDIRKILKNNKKYLMIGVISLGVIVGLFIIVKIIRKLKDRKIDKMLDNL